MTYRILSITSFIILIIGCASPKLMTYNDFSQIEDLELPKIVHLKSNDKEVLYFGTYHSNSINDTLFSIIEDNFNAFRPNLILHEGFSKWPIYMDKDSTIAISGEPGYIIQLAQINNIDYETIEPTESSEYQYLLKKYDLSWVVLMYLCRQIDNQQRFVKLKNTTDSEFIQNINYFLEMLVRDGMPLDKSQMSFSYWEREYKNLLGRKLDWRTFNPELYYPNKYLTKLNEVNRASDEFRNLFMIDKILESSQQYKRIMVLVGGGHLIVQEELLKYEFKKINI